MSNTDAYEQAQKQVKAKKKFHQHLGVYLVMSGFFFVLNMLTSPGHWWFYWPMLGWGIGLAMQYVNVYGLPGSNVNAPGWEEREIEKEMRRMEPRRRRQNDEIDDRLELREVEPEKTKQPEYRRDDLV